MPTTTKTTAKAIKAKSPTARTGKTQNIAQLLKEEVDKEPVTAESVAINTDEIPSVELPLAVTLTGMALQKATTEFTNAWKIEKEQELGLKLVRLIGSTLKGMAVPLIRLGMYGGSVSIERASTDEAKQIRAARWQRFKAMFSGRSSDSKKALEKESALADAPTRIAS